MKEKFKTGRPGFSFKDGKLYRFEKKSVLVLAPWPKPQAWFKSHRKPWHSSRKRADKAFTGALFPKWCIEAGLSYLDPDRDPTLRVWTGLPGVSGGGRNCAIHAGPRLPPADGTGHRE